VIGLPVGSAAMFALLRTWEKVVLISQPSDGLIDKGVDFDFDFAIRTGDTEG
jgi:hypothetical protein